MKKKRHARKGRKRRYGAGSVAAKPKRRVERVRNKKHKNQTGLRTMELAKHMYSKGAGLVPVKDMCDYVVMQELREQRKKPRDHVIGGVERSAEIRRWRAGRAKTRGESRKMREGGEVRLVGSSSRQVGVGEARSGEPRRDPKRRLGPGEGRKVKEESWKGRKQVRQQNQFGRGNRVRNGRTGRGYVIVDYRTGVRRVTRRPRTGEVRRPARMERGRWIRRK